MNKAKEFNIFCNHVENISNDMFNSLQANIREWYIKEYPSDKAGSFIEDYATFYDIVDSLYSRRDVYIYLHDSIIRERVFQRIAEMIELPYDTIYETWLAA